MRRVGAGRHILLADINEATAKAAAETFLDAGFRASIAVMDVASRRSIEALVAVACAIGLVIGLVHAAGVFPSMASPEIIPRVDLYGTAVLLETFGAVIAPGGAGGVIASQSGHRLGALTAEEDAALALTPSEALLSLPLLAPDKITDSLHAYQLSKRANVLRVKGEAPRWGKRGARINAISPGIVITPSRATRAVWPARSLL